MERRAERRSGRAWGAVPAVVAALVVGVGGCADADAPAAPDGPRGGGTASGPAAPGADPGPATEPAPATTATPSPATPATTATPSEGATGAPRSGAVLVEVVVNGGYAGVTNRLVVHEDGSWTVRSRDQESRGGRMTAAGLAGLRAALEDPAYARVPERPSGRPVADGFRYFVTHDHRLVVAGDGDRPAALQRVFDALPEGGPPTSP
ncbi:hypothetical protein [Streptomyces omiyaensis]|uniref:Lipoprotein n=1 Tax=Streptomyces omiyaensis TaxID=68247 RepID=A0ABW7BT83_9ACTN|nr:hypothetical protein [Streptomyces omiyaensis]